MLERSVRWIEAAPGPWDTADPASSPRLTWRGRAQLEVLRREAEALISSNPPW
jgi:hypothetical protein